MPNMQKFHQLLFAESENPDPYFGALKAIASISPAQLKALTGDLGWQLWSL